MKIAVILAATSLASAQAIDADIKELVASMTLEERVGSMVQLDVSTIMVNGEIDIERVRNHARNYHVGSYLGTPYSITGFGDTSDASRRNLRENTNPYSVSDWRGLLETIHHVYEQEGQFAPIYGVDSVHGANYVDNATIFPQQVNMGATFNRDLAVQFGDITARDTRATGIPWTFTPILDIGMQPSWPRQWECFSEDPFLTAELGKYVIHGIQGFENDLTDTTKIAACMKHFLGYGDSRSGHDRTPSWIPERYVLEYHVPAFQAAVDAGIATAMASFGDINGDAVTSSRRYLVDLLREQMGFEGMMVTDWAEIKNLHTWHKVAKSQKDASRMVMEQTSVDEHGSIGLELLRRSHGVDCRRGCHRG
jgi:beta-glucosidase